jgi:hypothetical protein
LLCQFGDIDQEAEAVFADLLSLPAGERYPPLPDDPRQKCERILVALVRHLESLAQRRPMLFLFEDAHWSDSTSLELLERLAERVRRLPVLVGEFVASLDHIERAIEILSAEGNQLILARTLVNGRCYSSRAGKLDRSLVLAGRVSDIADALNSVELRALRAWAAEPYFYKGLWDQAVLAAEEALPVAWEIGEWSAVFFSSAWLALAYLSRTASALGGAAEYAFFLPKPYANNDVEHLLRSVLPEVPSAAVHLP